jgi:hypothetical protein
VVASSTESLEESLQEDVEEARAELEEREAELEREREFGVSVYPAIVGDALAGDRVALIALGELSDETAEAIEFALRPTGARVLKVAVVRVPPDVGALADVLDGRARSQRLAEDPDEVEALGEMVGRQLVAGGQLLREAREQILTRFSGRGGLADHVILVRSPPEEPAGGEPELSARFEAGVVEGAAARAEETVGVERADDEPSSVPFFEAHDVPTVDSVELTSGKVAMVFVLLGADGNFGIKEDADRLLPDLIPPSPLPRGELARP